MVSTRGGGSKAPRRATAPRAAKAARVAPAPLASKAESDGLPLSDEICDALLESLAAVDVRSVAVLLCVWCGHGAARERDAVRFPRRPEALVRRRAQHATRADACAPARSRRFYRLGASNASLWRNAVLASPYADLLPRLDATWILASDRPHLLVARLFSRRCAYCEQPGEYWFTVQGRRVCQTCFELDIPHAAADTPFPVTELSAFLSVAPATAGSEEADAATASAGSEASGAAGAVAAAAPRRPPLCAYVCKSLAKTLFCLSDKEVNAVRSLTLTGIEDVRRTGLFGGADPKMTLVTAGDCLAAAVARYGSQAALLEEAESRRSSAQASFDAKRAEGKNPAKSPYLSSPTNFPHLNQSRHHSFTFKTGLGLEYAVRSPFFQASGGRVLIVGTAGTATAAGADFVSFAAAVRAAKNGDIIELLPGQHEAEISEDDENAHNGGGVSVSEAITIRGRRGDNGERPCVFGSRRVLVIINSCVIRDVTFRSTQVDDGEHGFYPTVLVCNTCLPLTNIEVFVEFEDCELRVPNRYNPHSNGLLARLQNGASAERTRVEFKRCVSGRVCAANQVKLLTDAASVIGEIVDRDE